MPQPTQGMVHVNRPLTNMSVAYLQSHKSFIADKVFPNISVLKQSDLYYTFPKGEWFRTDAQPRGVGQESAGSGYTLDTGSYFCVAQALHSDLDDQVKANTDMPLNTDADKALFVSRGMALRKEKDWASKFFIPNLWVGSDTGADIVPGTKWDVAGSTPIDDFNTQSTAMEELTGFRPNKLVITPKIWDKLKNNADFLDRITITHDKILSTALLAALLEIDTVHIARATENTAKEGQTAVMSWVYGDAALLLYAAPRPALQTPSAGYTYSWKGYIGGNANGVKMFRIPVPLTRSTRIEGEMAYDQKVVATDLGCYFASVLT